MKLRAAGAPLLALAACATLPRELGVGELRYEEFGRRLPRAADDTWSVALADLDGDGDLDALIGNRDGQDRLWLREGERGDVRFVDATSRLPVDRDFTADLAAADLDGDGDVDVLLASFGTRSRLYLNDGAANFLDHVAGLPGDEAFDQAVALGDLDGDGDVDAFFGTSLGQPDRLLLNDGRARFAAAATDGLARATATLSVALGDLDGDGDLDAFLGTQFGEAHHVYLNDGGARLTARDELAPPTRAHTQDVAIGDVDGDGDQDVVAVHGGRGPLALQADELYLNDGTGRLTTSASGWPAPREFSVALQLVDLDGDLDLDLLVGGRERVRFWSNDGSGRFAELGSALASTRADAFQDVFAVAAADLDADGRADVLLGVSEGENRLLLSGGLGALEDATESVPLVDPEPWLAALCPGDLDGDGRLDLYAAMGEERLARGAPDRLLFGRGDGSFRDGSAGLPDHVDISSSAALGDVDLDGDLDVLVGTAGLLGEPSANRLYLNDGGGRFMDASERLAGPDATWTVALVDLDGDGDLDAFIGNGSEFSGAVRPDRVLLGDGRGGFAEAVGALPRDTAESGASTVRWATRALAFGDVDGDLDVDVIVGDHAGPDRVLTNDGTARFNLLGEPLPGGSIPTSSLALADLDGDGRLDLARAAHGPTDASGVLFGTGTGSFRAGRSGRGALSGQTIARPWTTEVWVSDLTGDGLPDVLFGSASSAGREGGTVLFRGDGAGGFALDRRLATGGARDVTAVVVGDFDGDGGPDLVEGLWCRPARVHLSHRSP